VAGDTRSMFTLIMATIVHLKQRMTLYFIVRKHEASVNVMSFLVCERKHRVDECDNWNMERSINYDACKHSLLL